MSEPIRADTAPPATATFNLDGRTSSLYQDTREKRDPTPLLDSVGDLPFNPALIPSKVPFDGWDLKFDPNDPLDRGSDPTSQSWVFPSTPGGEHDLSGVEATLKRDRDTKASAKLEQALFDNFGREIGMYYGCRSDKDVDWYLKRTFERLKNTIVKYEALTSITLSAEQIAEKIKANLGTPLTATSEKYVSQLADYSQRVSQSLVKMRGAPGIDWSEPLGGSKGVLKDAGLHDYAKEWNKAGQGALFNVPKTDIRGEGICTVKSTAADRDAANHVNSKKITYEAAKAAADDTAKDAKADPSDRNALAVSENYLSKDKKSILPAPTQQDYDAVKDIGNLAILTPPTSNHPLSTEATKENEINNGATVAEDAQMKNKKFWENWTNGRYTQAHYQAIWNACKNKPEIYSIAFEGIPNAIALVEAFEQNLNRQSICQEACRQIGRSDCYN